MKNIAKTVLNRQPSKERSRALFRLSPLQIKQISKPGLYHDGGGLYLQVSFGKAADSQNPIPDARKSWVFRFRQVKRLRSMGLGPLADVPLAQARKVAQDLRGIVRDKRDPIAERRSRNASFAAMAETKPIVTFKTYAERFVALHASEWRNKKHCDQWINTLTKYAFPRLGAMNIADIDCEAVTQVLKPIWTDKAETASRIFQRIRKTINYAAAFGEQTALDTEGWEQIKARLGPNSKARKSIHHAACPHGDVAELIAAVKLSSASKVTQLAFEFGILTACRSGEVRGATWDEIEGDFKCWHIPAERMKSEREHTIPLSKRAKEILAIVKNLPLPKSKYIFPNTKGTAFSDMVFTQLLRRLKYPFTMHGFRASFRTWAMDNTDHPAEMLEMALAHIVGDQTVQAYARGAMLARRFALMEDWAQYIKIPKC